MKKNKSEIGHKTTLVFEGNPLSLLSNKDNKVFASIRRIEAYVSREGIHGFFPFFDVPEIDEKLMQSAYYKSFVKTHLNSIKSACLINYEKTNIYFSKDEVIQDVILSYQSELKIIDALKIRTNKTNHFLGEKDNINKKTKLHLIKNDSFIVGITNYYFLENNIPYLSGITGHFEDEDIKSKYIGGKGPNIFKKIFRKINNFFGTLFNFFFTLIFIIVPLLYIYSATQNIHRGEFTNSGVESTMKIFTDDKGLVHIKADTKHDAIFGLGFAQARDRLWQIDFLRRVSRGKLSEVIGEKALKIDIIMRQFGFNLLAERDLEFLSYNEEHHDTVNSLKKFSDGINFFVKNNYLPPEYIALFSSFENWEPLDSLAILRFETFIFNQDSHLEALYHLIEENLGKQFADSVLELKQGGNKGDVPFYDTTVLGDEFLKSKGLFYPRRVEGQFEEKVEEKKEDREVIEERIPTPPSEVVEEKVEDKKDEKEVIEESATTTTSEVVEEKVTDYKDVNEQSTEEVEENEEVKEEEKEVIEQSVIYPTSEVVEKSEDKEDKEVIEESEITPASKDVEQEEVIEENKETPTSSEEVEEKKEEKNEEKEVIEQSVTTTASEVVEEKVDEKKEEKEVIEQSLTTTPSEVQEKQRVEEKKEEKEVIEQSETTTPSEVVEEKVEETKEKEVIEQSRITTASEVEKEKVEEKKDEKEEIEQNKQTTSAEAVEEKDVNEQSVTTTSEVVEEKVEEKIEAKEVIEQSVTITSSEVQEKEKVEEKKDQKEVIEQSIPTPSSEVVEEKVELKKEEKEVIEQSIQSPSSEVVEEKVEEKKEQIIITRTSEESQANAIENMETKQVIEHGNHDENGKQTRTEKIEVSEGTVSSGTPTGISFSNKEEVIEAETQGEFNVDEVQSAASNSWVISGKYTKSGFPILGNDPHVKNSIPSMFYLAKIYYGEDDFIVGGSHPGIPIFAIGNNKHYSWGLTTENSDTIDFCEEKIVEGKKYQYDNETLNLNIIKDTIKIKGKEDFHHTLKWTKNGPLVDHIPSHFNEIGFNYKHYTNISVRVASNNHNNTSISGLISLNFARQKLENITDLLKSMKFPNFHLVMASVDDQISYSTIGTIPIKKMHNGLCKGYSSENVPTGEVGHLLLENPEKGYIVTANNKFSNNFIENTDGYFTYTRAARINELIESQIHNKKLTLEDLQKYQFDEKDLFASELLTKILAILKNNKKEHLQYYNELSQWKFELNRESREATVYSVLEIDLALSLLGNKLNKKSKDGIITSYLYWSYVHSIVNRIYKGEKVESRQCAEIQSGNKNCEDLIVRIFENLDNTLTSLDLKENGEIKKWGEVHFNYYPNIFFERIPYLKKIFGRKIFEGGNRNTLKLLKTVFKNLPSGIFESTHSAGFMYNCDMSDSKRPNVAIPIGNSGNIFSKYYDNLLENTKKNQHFKVIHHDFETHENTIVFKN